jgi:hypothetical protein
MFKQTIKLGSAVVLALCVSQVAMAGKAVPKKDHPLGWVAVCHQMTSPGNSQGNPKILFVPTPAANSDSSDHKGSGKPGNPGGGHDDYVIGPWSVGDRVPTVRDDCPGGYENGGGYD